MDQRLNGCKDQRRGSGADRYLGLWTINGSGLDFSIAGDPFTQGDISRHGRVLIAPRCHGLNDFVLKGFGGVEIRKSLAHVERSMLRGQRAHFGENRGTDPRKFRGLIQIAHERKLPGHGQFGDTG